MRILAAPFFVTTLAFSALLSFSGEARANSAEWVHAHELYEKTEYEASLKTLLSVRDKDAEVLQLIGQDYFRLGDYKKAAEFLEQAFVKSPGSSQCAMWIGRAYGRRAETSSVFTAPGYANKSRQAFEKAIELDPANREAAGDLFDYYLEAPGFLGGGEQKAEALAANVARHDPAEGQYYQAQIADRHKQYDRAEQHFRTALEIAPRQVGRVIDLARFLSERGKTKESEALFESAMQLAPDNPRIMFERAKTYVHDGRNLDEARQLLQRYLKSPLTANDPPRQEAEALLKKAGA